MRVLLTGPTCAIGREVARGLVAAGADVILACRDPGKAAELQGRVHVLDLASPAKAALRVADQDRLWRETEALIDRFSRAA